MAQLDVIIIFPLILGLLVTLFLHYKFVIELEAITFFGVQKLRNKKLNALPLNFFEKTVFKF